MVKLKTLSQILLVVLSCSFMYFPALAQDGDDALWPRPAQDLWETVNADFVGPFDLDRDYTYEYNIPQSLVERYFHALEASATEGRTRIVDIMSVAGSFQGSHLWTSTNMGHDDLNTGAPLTASESTAAGRCDAVGDTRSGAIMNSGFNAEVMLGAVRANTSMDPGVMEYRLSANGEAAVTAGAAARTAHGDTQRIQSQQDYSQNITVAGDIQKFDYMVEFYGQSNMLCGTWD